ncbi:MAG: AI-2E family transporter [Vicinamibacterales bacterium]
MAGADTAPASRPSSPSSGRMALWILAVLAAVLFLRTASSLLIPIVVSVLLSYALEPVVEWLACHRLPRFAGAALVLSLLLGLAMWGGYALRDDISRAASAIPDATREAADWIGLGPGAARQAEQAARSPSPALLQQGASWLMAAAGSVTVVVFLTYFLLLSGSHFKERFLELAGRDRERRQATIGVLDDINTQVQRFLLVRAGTAVVVAAATWAALQALGLQQAAVWGLAAGLFNSIPYFGPVIVSGGLFVVGLTQFGDIWPAIQVSAAALAVTSAEGWLLLPPLLGKTERMHMVVVFLGLLVWTWIWGAWGTILAVPMLSIVKAVCDHVPTLRPVARLLAR